MKTIVKYKDAVKEAKEIYRGVQPDEWTEKEFIEDYVRALEEDGYIIV